MERVGLSPSFCACTRPLEAKSWGPAATARHWRLRWSPPLTSRRKNRAFWCTSGQDSPKGKRNSPHGSWGAERKERRRQNKTSPSQLLRGPPHHPQAQDSEDVYITSPRLTVLRPSTQLLTLAAVRAGEGLRDFCSDPCSGHLLGQVVRPPWITAWSPGLGRVGELWGAEQQ